MIKLRNFNKWATYLMLRKCQVSQLLERMTIFLSVSGKIKQDSNANKVIWSIPEIITNLPGLFTVKPCDLIYIGTPEGLGPVTKGNVITVGIDGLTALTTNIT